MDCSLGFLEKSAIHANNAKYSYLNPYWEVTQSWGDMRMGASIDSYLNGYADPRAKVYFAEAANGGGIHGVYPGLQIRNQSDYTGSHECRVQLIHAVDVGSREFLPQS